MSQDTGNKFSVVSLIKRTEYTIAAGVPLANWFQRFVCVILDYFITAFAFYIFMLFVIYAWLGPEQAENREAIQRAREWSAFACYIGFAFYRPITQALFGQTLAERFLRIYVANAQRTQLNFLQVIKRHACPAIIWLSVALNIAVQDFATTIPSNIALLIWVGGSLRAFSSDRRTLLDLFSGSYVYKKPK